MLTFSNVWSNNLNGMSFSVERASVLFCLMLTTRYSNDIVDIMNWDITPGSGSIYLDGKNFLDPKNKRTLRTLWALLTSSPPRAWFSGR